MTPEKLAELEALEKAASGGTWQAGVAGSCNLVRFDGDDITGIALVGRDANLAFIAASRTAVPELIAEVRRLAAENRAMRELAEAVRDLDRDDTRPRPSHEWNLVLTALADADRALSATTEKMRGRP